MTTIVLASNNQGKLAEFRTLFDGAGLALNIVPQGELGIDDAVEDGLSFVENAIIKARHASRASGLPAVADDSGLVVPVLGNAPGIYSARFAGEHGNDAANNAKLLKELEKFRTGAPIVGKFICVLAMVRHADDPLPIIAQGEWMGEILPELRGENGFGYDPLFYIPALDKTSAELDKAQKNAISHRGQALQVLLERLKAEHKA
ncbi:non-canonical purine NTP pyrophosphatase, RdgB/HAM1 family [Moraxella caviae]|uniref:dITP/XTP pyrophosphatase n=1 Tax=Moraxella caviae TaxID=34060 RepID=A0A1S9ZYC9_9GAMM|nr:RdgB/HAM1 family non-canonical purine NTP pyrophosphatase [Moraxella caviae]OOR87981.1 non-canonical purine NTP pyrophosphatase, RdgB/HAM1 family [Moraxella caviae]STZ09713.1 dITP/XTP pyrophosphatase [Moraxella caviae]